MCVVGVGCEVVVIDWWLAMNDALGVAFGAHSEWGPFLEGELGLGI